VLLIDADTLVYAAASRSETNTDWGDGTWSLTANLPEAQTRLTADIKRIIKRCRAGDFVLALSDYDNSRWREDVLASYKQNRTTQRKPLVYDALRQWVAAHPKAQTWPRLEGDDVLGILMTNPNYQPGTEKVCVSIDKDLMQVPGPHINYQNARDNLVWNPTTIRLDEADRFHAYQTLTGDSVDGYKGCPSVGPKRAESALSRGSGVSEWWQIVREQYQMKGLGEDEVLKQARVARILRHEDYDFEKGEVRLWNLPLTEA
jgi:DNA polymerase-1